MSFMTEPAKYVILFVCSGNTCRSPMAEYALRCLIERERPDGAEVLSAGTLGLQGQPATRYAQEAGWVWDLDMSSHLNQPLTPELIERADLILAMAPEHHQKILEMVSKASDKTYLLKNFPDHSGTGERVEDPIGMDLDAYNEVFLEIGEYLGKHLPKILNRLDGKPNA
jgi:protein-tyrosine phosphatase